jgi:hypothetical protein
MYGLVEFRLLIVSNHLFPRSLPRLSSFLSFGISFSMALCCRAMPRSISAFSSQSRRRSLTRPPTLDATSWWVNTDSSTSAKGEHNI